MIVIMGGVKIDKTLCEDVTIFDPRRNTFTKVTSIEKGGGFYVPFNQSL